MLTMGADPCFVDTNMLIYNDQPRSMFHTRAQSILRGLVGSGSRLWISRQIIREYLVTMTRPNAAGIPFMSHAEAAHAATQIGAAYEVADEDACVTACLAGLVERFQVSGRQIHDANIVATMLTTGVTALATWNAVDFRRYTPLITLVVPADDRAVPHA